MKQKIIAEYNRLKLEFSRPPTRDEMVSSGFDKRLFIKYFGTYSDLKRLVGDKLPKFIPEQKQCIVCDKTFKTTIDNRDKTYCSTSCANTIVKRKHEIKHCFVCNKKHKNPISNFCSYYCQMFHRMQTTTIADITQFRKGGANAYDLIRSNARSISKYYFNLQEASCTHCGYDKHVEVCHITDIKDFDITTLLSVVNAKENLILLCRNCHWEFDHP